MSDGIWSAASGATTLLLSLDAVANNLANTATPGYKADNAVFREHLMSAVDGGHNVKEMRFSAIDAMAHDFSGGPITATKRPLDAAIDGEGFFAITTPQGERYTRAGSFDVNSSGELVAVGGAKVLGENNRPIVIPPNQQGVTNARITADGNIESDGNLIGRLKLVKFTKQDGLVKEGHLLFSATQASGAARVAPVRLEPEALEGANFSVVKGMTSMVTTTRTFDAINRVIDTFNDIDRRAAMDVGRIR
jgi:flagellar basal-body rod protein FlgF